MPLEKALGPLSNLTVWSPIATEFVTTKYGPGKDYSLHLITSGPNDYDGTNCRGPGYDRVVGLLSLSRTFHDATDTTAKVYGLIPNDQPDKYNNQVNTLLHDDGRAPTRFEIQADDFNFLRITASGGLIDSHFGDVTRYVSRPTDPAVGRELLTGATYYSRPPDLYTWPLEERVFEQLHNVRLTLKTGGPSYVSIEKCLGDSNAFRIMVGGWGRRDFILEPELKADSLYEMRRLQLGGVTFEFATQGPEGASLPLPRAWDESGDEIKLEKIS